MEVSKVIVEEQDRQRQKLLRVVRGKVSKDVEVRKTWRNLIHHCTQERYVFTRKKESMLCYIWKYYVTLLLPVGNFMLS